MATKVYKPILFGISPAPVNDYRLSELISNAMTRCKAASGTGIYADKLLESLTETLQYFVDINTAYPGPLVCVVNTHGMENTGYFEDSDRQLVTPEHLWGKIKVPVVAYLNQPGGRNVYLVMAQCYGSIFADGLRQIIQSDNQPPIPNVHVVGLSYGATFSGRSVSPEATIGTEAHHKALEKWMKKFENAEDPGNATQPPGVGARLQQAANRPAPANCACVHLA